MGKFEKLFIEFVDSIPEDKLEGSLASGTIHTTDNFCLDNQGETSNEPRCWNLQFQLNRQSSISYIRRRSPASTAGCLAPIKNPWTPAQIKRSIKKSFVNGVPLGSKGLMKTTISLEDLEKGEEENE